MNKLISRAVGVGMLAASLAFVSPAMAATAVGNAPASGSSVDSYSNFTVVDTNNPVSASGALGTFSYYAANTNPFEFVLVDSGNVVQWISPTITPAAVGVNTWTSTTTVMAQAGWNLGVHFDSTGTIPFNATGTPALYTPNNNGMPVMSAALTIEGTSSRTYSFGADAAIATTSTTTIGTAMVTTTIEDSTGTATTSADAGASVYDVAMVSAVSPATTTPTGTVDFTLYADTSCTGTSTVEPGVALVNGSASSSMATVGANGLSYMANYDGQADVYMPADGMCESLSTPVGTTTGTTTSGTGSISGTVYNDLNRNGAKDGNEPGLSGWTINLYDNAGWSGPTNKAPIMSAVSDANGNYSFSNLADGTYSIEEINQPNGLNQFTSDYRSVIVSGGAALTNMNFGNVSGNPYSTTVGSGNGGTTGTSGNNGNGSGGNKGSGNSGGNSGGGSSGDKGGSGKGNGNGNHGNPHR